MIFTVVCGVISFLLGSLAAPFDPLTWGEPIFPQSWTSFAVENPGITALPVILGLVLSPLLALIGFYIGALIQHLFVAIFVRQGSGFEATLRVVAYAYPLSLVSWIPVIGYLVILYGVYVYTMGFRELHSTSTTRALLAALVPTLVSIAFTLFFILLPEPTSMPSQ